MIQIKSKVFKIHNKDQEEHGLDLNRETVHSELQIDQKKKYTMNFKLKVDIAINRIYNQCCESK